MQGRVLPMTQSGEGSLRSACERCAKPLAGHDIKVALSLLTSPSHLISLFLPSVLSRSIPLNIITLPRSCSLITTTLAKTRLKMRCSTSLSLATVLAPLVVSASPVKRAVDSDTVTVLSE